MSQLEARRAVPDLQRDVSGCRAVHVGAVDRVHLQHLARAAGVAERRSHGGGDGVADGLASDRGWRLEVRCCHDRLASPPVYEDQFFPPIVLRNPAVPILRLR